MLQERIPCTIQLEIKAICRGESDKMSVYKRVNCPTCRTNKELRNGDDKLKKITCRHCGHTFEIKPERSIYWISFRLANGELVRESLGVVSRSFAETVLCKRKAEVAQCIYFGINKIKFEDFAQDYFKKHSKEHKRSWITDSFHINDFNLFFKGKYLSKISVEDIDNFKIERRKLVAEASVNRQLSLLRAMFNKAIAWGKLKDNPVKSVRFYSEPDGRNRFLEKEQMDNLIINCDTRLRPIVILALYTGMRKGEILNLKWHDIDFKRNIITLLKTKNGKVRYVPMNLLVKSALSDIARHPESPYIFCNDNGQRLKDMRKSFATALKKSGIINFHFHDCRHTFSSQLAISGVDMNRVRELLGHRDISMTLRYSHLAQNHLQEAVDILAAGTTTTQQRLLEKQQNFEIVQPFNNEAVTTPSGSFLS